MPANGRWDLTRHLKDNPSNAQLNPLCHLLALLGAHPILYVSRISPNVSFTALVIACFKFFHC